jgi:hypothetical protein
LYGVQRGEVLKGEAMLYRSAMKIAQNRKILIAGVLAVAVLSASCSSSGTDPADSTTVTGADEAGTEQLLEEAVVEMCRTLDLFSFAGTPPGNASVAMNETDLVDATAGERTAYGRLLIEAPRAECSEHARYADEIAYWLGF